MSDNRPIGIFDSGLGGITVAKEIYKVLPNESTIYIGDTARVPYGNRSPNTVTAFTKESVQKLIALNVKAIVIACGTASSVALESLSRDFPQIPITGVIKPAAKDTCLATQTGQIGVIGTNATINSQSFTKAINQLNQTIIVHSKSCPLFVPIVEEGISHNSPILTATIKHYLTEFKHLPIDTLIMGCTHYPIIQAQINQFLPHVKPINVGLSLSLELSTVLSKLHLSNHTPSPTHQYYVTDLNQNFQTTAELFLGEAIQVKPISLLET